MTPDSSAADNEDIQPLEPSSSASESSLSQSVPSSLQPDPTKPTPTTPTSPSDVPPTQPTAGPLETLQRRYTDQLSQDIERLEADKAKLQAEIAALRQDYVTLHTQARQLRETSAIANSPPANYSAGVDSAGVDSAGIDSAESASSPASGLSSQPELPKHWQPGENQPASEAVPPLEKIGLPIGPRLPGEADLPIKPSTAAPSESVSARQKSLELPTPATSERQRRRQRKMQAVSEEDKPLVTFRRKSSQKGWVLSAIATLLIAWHYGLVHALTQGGSWLGLNIEALGTGFVPAAGLLWLRMLVIVPALVLLAPQLHRNTWEDVQLWIASREKLLAILIGSGVALFFSQVLLYQSIGLVGPVVATSLMFLYPLTAVPLGLWLQQERSLSPFGLLAMVAIAMGGLLVSRPLFGTALTSALADSGGVIWPGVLASVFLSLYIVLTNISYRQQCHPMPVAVVQFSTVATLSSLVLLVKPLTLAEISWVGFFSLGIFVGTLMLMAYLLTYVSLKKIGAKTAIVAATTPLVMLLLAFSFSPQQPLEIIQWTGILLVSIGGVALSKEKLNSVR